MVVYIDGVRVGEALALEETPHHIIHRLCELDLAVSELEQPPRQKGVGFRLKLPTLTEGKHEVWHCSLCVHLTVVYLAGAYFRGHTLWGALAPDAAHPHRVQIQCIWV